MKQILSGQPRSDRVTFNCRLREKTQPRCDTVTYASVNVSGHLECEYLSQLIYNRTQNRHHRHHQSPFSPAGDDGNTSCNAYSAYTSSPDPSQSSIYSNISSPCVSPLPPQNAPFYGHKSLFPAPHPHQQQQLLQQITSYMSSCTLASSGSLSSDYNDNRSPGSRSHNNCQEGMGRNGSSCAPLSTMTTNDMNIMFLCFVEITPQYDPTTELKLVYTNYDEYISRHSLDGTLIYADNRFVWRGRMP